MELNKLEFLRRELKTNNQIGIFVNRPRSVSYIINKNIKEQIHTIQNTQARWNARREKRKLQELYKNDNLEYKRKRL